MFLYAIMSFCPPFPKKSVQFLMSGPDYITDISFYNDVSLPGAPVNNLTSLKDQLMIGDFLKETLVSE